MKIIARIIVWAGILALVLVTAFGVFTGWFFARGGGRMFVFETTPELQEMYPEQKETVTAISSAGNRLAQAVAYPLIATNVLWIFLSLLLLVLLRKSRKGIVQQSPAGDRLKAPPEE